MDKYKNKSQKGREICCNLRRKGENKVKWSERFSICTFGRHFPASGSHAHFREISRTSNNSIKKSTAKNCFYTPQFFWFESSEVLFFSVQGRIQTWTHKVPPGIKSPWGWVGVGVIINCYTSWRVYLQSICHLGNGYITSTYSELSWGAGCCIVSLEQNIYLQLQSN